MRESQSFRKIGNKCFQKKTKCTCKQIIFNAQEKSLSLSLNSKHALMHSKHNHGVCHLSHTSGVPSKVPTERNVRRKFLSFQPASSTTLTTGYYFSEKLHFATFQHLPTKKKQEKKKKNKTHFSIVDSIFHFSDALSCVMWLRAFDTNTHTHTHVCVQNCSSHILSGMILQVAGCNHVQERIPSKKVGVGKKGGLTLD